MSFQKRYISDERETSLSSSTPLPNVPDGANYCIIDVEDQNVRWKGKGGTPTASDGGLMRSGSQYEYDGDLKAVNLIEVVGGAAITVTYYKRVSV